MGFALDRQAWVSDLHSIAAHSEILEHICISGSADADGAGIAGRRDDERETCLEIG